MDVVLRNNVEIVYDQIITTSRPVGANRPDIIIKDEANNKSSKDRTWSAVPDALLGVIS